MGIAARGDYDLTQHQKASGKNQEYFDEELKQKYIPQVSERSERALTKTRVYSR